MIKGFKRFILRGNVADLAVAVVIGVAFGAVVTAIVGDVLMPIIGSIFGSTDLKSLTIGLRGKNVLAYGLVLNAIISFLAVAAAVYFLVVAPLNALQARRQKQAEPTTRPCPYCTTETALTATRCPACTSEVPATA